MNTTFFRRGFVIILLLFSLLQAPVTHAQFSDQNSLLSLVKNNTGGILNAALSCNKHVSGFLDRLTSLGSGGGAGSGPGGQSTGGGEAVRTTDSATAQNTSDTKIAAQATQKKLNCKNAIEKAAAQAIIKELTLRTVNWINNGFQDGRSIFIPDTKTFLDDLKREGVNEIASIIGFDSENYPFGPNAVRRAGNSLKATIESSMAYNLTKLVQNQGGGNPNLTAADFYNTFSLGGWDAFLAQSMPNNNPYGFELRTQDLIANALADTAYTKAQDIRDQISRNFGFLDLKGCADKTWTKPTTAQINAIKDQYKSDPKKMREELSKLDCPQPVTKTPGSIAGEQLSQVLASPIKQLEIGTDLSASLTSIFDALTIQLINKGLSSLEGDEYTSNDPDFEESFIFTNVLIDDSLGSSGRGIDEWWRNDTFDLLDEGEDGLLPFIEQEVEYREIFTGGVNVGIGQIEAIERLLIPATYQLDLCIPGPNPNWEPIAYQNIQNFLAEAPKSADDVLGSGSKIVSGILGFGNGFNNTIRDGTIDSRNQTLYSELLKKILGVGILKNETIGGFSNFSYALTALVQRYGEAIEENYSQVGLNVPAVAGVSDGLFREVPGRRQLALDARENNNSSRIIENQLKNLFEDIQEFNQTYPNASNLTPEQQEEYDKDYAKIERTFLRLAPDIHTRDDILNERDILEEILSVFDDITEEGGYIDDCFEDLADPDYQGRRDRRPYPQELLGDTLFDSRLSTDSLFPGFNKNPPKYHNSFLGAGTQILPDGNVRQIDFYRFTNIPKLDKEDNNGIPLPWYGISTSDLFFVTNDYGANGLCGDYYDPQTVSYGSNLFGKPKYRGGEAKYSPQVSCVEGLENVMGVY